MAEQKIIWTPQAKNELKESLEYYIKRNGNPKYSSWLFSEIQRRIQLLKKFPELGHPGINDRARILPFINYGIIYEKINSSIVILSFWDFRRNPNNRIDIK